MVENFSKFTCYGITIEIRSTTCLEIFWTRNKVSLPLKDKRGEGSGISVSKARDLKDKLLKYMVYIYMMYI